MKLRRRKKEVEDYYRVLCHPPASPRPEPMLHLLLPPSFLLSFPPPSPTSPHPPPQLALRHGSGEQCPPAISSPAVPLLPSFFIKLLKQQSVEGRTVAGVQLVDPAVLLNDNTAGAQLAAPYPHPIGWPTASSSSRGTLSVTGGAIGKQRPKMNYPVSSPSLTNK